jgi:hypothetical protein
LLLKTESSSFWKQATTNSIQDDKQFPFQATTRQQLVNKQHQHSNHTTFSTTRSTRRTLAVTTPASSCMFFKFLLPILFILRDYLQITGGHHHLAPHLALQRRRLPSEGFLFYFISPTRFHFKKNRRPTSMKGAQTRNFVWALGRCFL